MPFSGQQSADRPDGEVCLVGDVHAQPCWQLSLALLAWPSDACTGALPWPASKLVVWEELTHDIWRPGVAGHRDECEGMRCRAPWPLQIHHNVLQPKEAGNLNRALLRPAVSRLARVFCGDLLSTP